MTPGAFPAVVVPSGSKTGLSLASDSSVVSRPDALVRGHALNGNDLVVVAPCVLRRRGALLRPVRPGVLLLAADPELARDHRVVLHHVQRVVGVREAVEDHRVDQLAVTQPVAEARLLQQVRRVRHRLHPAGDDHLVIAGADHRVRDLDGADRRGADLVDRVRGRLLRQPGTDRRLARGRLARTRLEHLSHDHVLGLVRLEADSLERRLDHDRRRARSPGSRRGRRRACRRACGPQRR